MDINRAKVVEISTLAGSNPKNSLTLSHKSPLSVYKWSFGCNWLRENPILDSNPIRSNWYFSILNCHWTFRFHSFLPVVPWSLRLSRWDWIQLEDLVAKWFTRFETYKDSFDSRHEMNITQCKQVCACFSFSPLSSTNVSFFLLFLLFSKMKVSIRTQQ